MCNSFLESRLAIRQIVSTNIIAQTEFSNSKVHTLFVKLEESNSYIILPSKNKGKQGTFAVIVETSPLEKTEFQIR